MAEFGTDSRGAGDDSVRLVVGGQDVLIAEHYDVHISILTQPSVFALRLGHGGTVRDILRRVQNNDPFELYIGGALQQSGAISEVSVEEASGSMVVIEGYDRLAPVHNGFVENEKSYANKTYKQLALDVLKETLGNAVTIAADNAANRRVMTGSRALPGTEEPKTVDEIEEDKFGDEGASYRIVRSKLGERRYDFLKRHLDLAGLFLWAAADGSFVLKSPNGKQPPMAKIVRRRGQLRNEVSVFLETYRNSTKPPRYSECVVYARTGGRKFKRSTVLSSFVDEEMANVYKIDRKLVIRDADVHTPEQAAFLARRKLAEGRRACWQLAYRVAGHSTPGLGGGRVVWAPDTVVQVTDDELDIDGLFWVEGVNHRRVPQTETVLHLMRPDDLIFGVDT